MLCCNVGGNGGVAVFDMGRVVTMKWVRSNIKLGARLALFAFAVQLALSFGHFHAVVAQAAPSIQSAHQHLPSPSPDSDPGDTCAICAVIALAGTALFATPPALPLPQAVELPLRTTETAFPRLRAARAAFQSRAPPLS
jgi:hypothetical protein